MIFLWAGLLLFTGYACLLLTYYRWWKQVPEFEGKESGALKISLVIAARNEAASIGHLLDALMLQTFPSANLEIIVVNDHSTDDTAKVVLRYPQVKLLTLPENLTTKKKALQYGIEAATGDLIVTTDADCIPGPEWLSSVAAFYNSQPTSFIAAPVKYAIRNNVLDCFQAIDFMMLQGITAGSVHAGFHAMCNGANLAYSRQAFKEVNGFDKIDHRASGDDMLLMYKIWAQHPGTVHFLKSYSATITTLPPQTWSAFFSQRKRWASKTPSYKDRTLLPALAGVYIFNLLFFVYLIAGFFHPVYFMAALAYIILKTLAELPLLISTSRFFGQQRLLYYFVFLQPLHCLYIVITGIASQAGSYEWKGRRLK